jgi:hypothetical protein
VSEEANARLRERRATDAEYRQRENATKMRYVLRKRAELAGEPIPENALPRPKTEDPWLRLWLGLNSESEAEVQQAKKDVRHRMDCMLAMASKACAATEPKRVVQEEPEESFGLADDR